MRPEGHWLDRPLSHLLIIFPKSDDRCVCGPYLASLRLRASICKLEPDESTSLIGPLWGLNEIRKVKGLAPGRTALRERGLDLFSGREGDFGSFVGRHEGERRPSSCLGSPGCVH